MIHIRNKHTYKGEGVYIGRPSSPLGNPFSHIPSKYAEVMVGSRNESIDRYESWLREKLKSDPVVRATFDELVSFYRDFGELTLICWCKPKRCHGDIIARMIEEAILARATHNEHQEQSQAVEEKSGSEDVQEQDLAGKDSMETAEG